MPSFLATSFGLKNGANYFLPNTRCGPYEGVSSDLPSCFDLSDFISKPLVTPAGVRTLDLQFPRPTGDGNAYLHNIYVFGFNFEGLGTYSQLSTCCPRGTLGH